MNRYRGLGPEALQRALGVKPGGQELAPGGASDSDIADSDESNVISARRDNNFTS